MTVPQARNAIVFYYYKTMCHWGSIIVPKGRRLAEAAVKSGAPSGRGVA